MGKRFGVLILFFALAGAGIFLGTVLSDGRDPRVEEPSAPSVLSDRERIRVEVLNGGGVPDVAWEATVALRDSGFDVVFYGNAGTYSDQPSVVLDRVGKIETARLVANALGIPQVLSEPDSTLYVEVTVRLGPDWTKPPG